MSNATTIKNYDVKFMEACGWLLRGDARLGKELNSNK